MAARMSAYSVIVWPRVLRTTDSRAWMNIFVTASIFISPFLQPCLGITRGIRGTRGDARFGAPAAQEPLPIIFRLRPPRRRALGPGLAASRAPTALRAFASEIRRWLG